MIHGKKILAIVPARGGSKGVPRKNLRILQGRPLLAWTLDEAKKSKYIDSLVLTSDDLEILQIGTEHGCDVALRRPEHLSSDTATTVDVVQHVLESIQGHFDYLVLLQPTSPLRTVQDIDESIVRCISVGACSCVSVREVDEHPFWMLKKKEEGNFFVPFLSKELSQHHRRQDLPVLYYLNGAVYVTALQWFRENKRFVSEETLAYVMPKDRSVDVDSEMDLLFIEALLKNNKQ